MLLCKQVVSEGGLIYIDDGLLQLRILEISADKVWCKTEVLNTQQLSNHKGVNLPDGFKKNNDNNRKNLSAVFSLISSVSFSSSILVSKSL